MVSMKILVFAAVVAVVAANPTLHHVGKTIGLVGKTLNAVSKPWWPAWKHKAGERHSYKQGEKPLEPLGYLAKGVTDLAGNAGDILRDVSQLRIPATFDDAINAVISVGRAAAGIVNAVIPGLGSLLGNIILAVAKILICVLGSPGLTGSLLADRRGGYGNSRDIPAICQKNYGQNHGCKAYTGGYKSPSDVIDFYDLGNCKSKINSLVDKATKGKGVSALSGSEKIIVELLLKISAMLSRKSSSDWSQKDIESVSVDVTIMIGVIGNGYSVGYGPDLIENLIDFILPAFKSKGLDLSSHEDNIKKQIENCGSNDFGGALKHNDDNNEQSYGNDGINLNNGGSGNSGSSLHSYGDDGINGNNGGSGNESSNNSYNSSGDNSNSSNGNNNNSNSNGGDDNDNSNEQCDDDIYSGNNNNNNQNSNNDNNNDNSNEDCDQN